MHNSGRNKIGGGLKKVGYTPVRLEMGQGLGADDRGSYKYA